MNTFSSAISVILLLAEKNLLNSDCILNVSLNIPHICSVVFDTGWSEFIHFGKAGSELFEQVYESNLSNVHHFCSVLIAMRCDVI